MYHDANEIWDDGEEAVITINDWVESSYFYLAVTRNSAIKCMKDEERAPIPSS